MLCSVAIIFEPNNTFWLLFYIMLWLILCLTFLLFDWPHFCILGVMKFESIVFDCVYLCLATLCLAFFIMILEVYFLFGFHYTLLLIGNISKFVIPCADTCCFATITFRLSMCGYLVDIVTWEHRGIPRDKNNLKWFMINAFC